MHSSSSTTPHQSHSLLLRPPEVLAQHVIQFLVVLAEVFPELGHDRRPDVRVFPAFGLLQALVHRTIPQAVESLSPVEIKVVCVDPVLEAQERLDAVQLGHGVSDESVAVDHE